MITYLFLVTFQWNNKGYDVAKSWAPKFTHISPVWLQVKRQNTNSYVISGLHDVDHGWIQSVTRRGSSSDIKSKNHLLFSELILHPFVASQYIYTHKIRPLV